MLCHQISDTPVHIELAAYNEENDDSQVYCNAQANDNVQSDINARVNS